MHGVVRVLRCRRQPNGTEGAVTPNFILIRHLRFSSLGGQRPTALPATTSRVVPGVSSYRDRQRGASGLCTSFGLTRCPHQSAMKVGRKSLKLLNRTLLSSMGASDAAWSLVLLPLVASCVLPLLLLPPPLSCVVYSGYVTRKVVIAGSYSHRLQQLSPYSYLLPSLTAGRGRAKSGLSSVAAYFESRSLKRAQDVTESPVSCLLALPARHDVSEAEVDSQ